MKKEEFKTYLKSINLRFKDVRIHECIEIYKPREIDILKIKKVLPNNMEIGHRIPNSNLIIFYN